MVQYYNILGAKFASHHLAMGVLAVMFGGGITATMRGGGSKTAQNPPIDAASNEEADFIKKFLEQAEAESKSKTNR